MMETVRLLCDNRPCPRVLRVVVDDEYGPWRGKDAERLLKTASRRGWFADIDPRDGYARQFCPKHSDG